MEHLQRIESRHGRQRAERWAARTLDIDLLLYGDEVIETPQLTVPHLRMTFRRFVLEPAAEIAPRMIHPVIGWPIERLLLHLDAAKDELVVLSPSETLRDGLTAVLTERFAARSIVARRRSKQPIRSGRRPTRVGSALIALTQRKPTGSAENWRVAYAAAAFPKLTILLDADGDAPTAVKSEWSAIVRQPGRGPTLRLQQSDQATIRSRSNCGRRVGLA